MKPNGKWSLRTALNGLFGTTERRGSESRVRVTPPAMHPRGMSGIVELVREDVRAVMQHDPAARNAVEVLLFYPGFHAVWGHRVAHTMWRMGLTTSARAVSHANRFVTGIEIHPGATIGRRVFIDHGMGIVIGETATVGDDCLLYKGVVLGGTSLERRERHPTLGSGVVVGTNACVLGAIYLGDGARIGSGSVVIRDVPEGATVVGIPGRVVEMGGMRTIEQLDHAALPDPVANAISSLLGEIEDLRREVAAIRGDEPPPRRAGRDFEHESFDGEEE